jgi:hypothetical protein
MQMETLWINGYTAFVNIEATKCTSAEIANGAIDPQIRSWARAFAGWAKKGEDRFAYLAPLAEMNGDWVIWGRDPYNYILTFKRLQRLFSEESVPANSVRWVFAPNGWSKPGTPGFEAYYPGDAYVDVVGFSGYNFGSHPYTPTPDWQDPIEVYGPYLERMVLMAPEKPIFITQTATTSYHNGSPNPAKKNSWLRDAYTYLVDYPNVRGVMYFNIDNWQSVDWPFYVSGNQAYQYEGYREGITDQRYRYIRPAELAKTKLITNAAP